MLNRKSQERTKDFILNPAKAQGEPKQGAAPGKENIEPNSIQNEPQLRKGEWQSALDQKSNRCISLTASQERNTIDQAIKCRHERNCISWDTNLSKSSP